MSPDACQNYKDTFLYIETYLTGIQNTFSVTHVLLPNKKNVYKKQDNMTEN